MTDQDSGLRCSKKESSLKIDCGLAPERRVDDDPPQVIVRWIRDFQ
jgi:hypothetical protein